MQRNHTWRHVIALVAFVVMTWLAWLRRHHPLAAVFLLRGLLGGRRARAGAAVTLSLLWT